MLLNRIRCYIQLTKPSIMLLVLVTGTSALVMEGRMLDRPLDFLLVLAGLFLTGGSANALNQYFERDIDAVMSRTRRRRPLPLKKLREYEALAFAITIGICGVVLFALRFNILSAVLALVTVLFYGLFYTLWLKPSTHQNIVIGGAAGAMAPVISWAAAANNLAMTPFLLFLIIFLWTPPHFWALALYLKEDYRKVNLPMLPVVKGDEETVRQMLYYSVALVAVSLCLVFVDGGLMYAFVAAVSGFIFIRKCAKLRHNRSHRLERNLFQYSILYLFSLFLTIIVEGVWLGY